MVVAHGSNQDNRWFNAECRLTVTLSHCDHHAQTGETSRYHIEIHHQSDHRPNMGMWDYFVSHIQLKNGADATIEHLLGSIGFIAAPYAASRRR
jgi:hypothetical protein